MSSVMDRLTRRQHAPLELPDGSMVYVRTPTRGERKAMKPFVHPDDPSRDEDIRDGLGYALTLVDDCGQQLCPQLDGESFEDYGKRASEFFAGLPPEIEAMVMAKIQQLSVPPSLEKLVKN